jgi:hypothetical protein
VLVQIDWSTRVPKKYSPNGGPLRTIVGRREMRSERLVEAKDDLCAASYEWLRQGKVGSRACPGVEKIGYGWDVELSNGLQSLYVLGADNVVGLERSWIRRQLVSGIMDRRMRF